MCGLAGFDRFYDTGFGVVKAMAYTQVCGFLKGLQFEAIWGHRLLV